LEKPTFHPLGDFFKACPSRAKAGFKKIAKMALVSSQDNMAQEPFSEKKPKVSQTKYQINDINQVICAQRLICFRLLHCYCCIYLEIFA
jgi:hypothetical protein